MSQGQDGIRGPRLSRTVRTAPLLASTEGVSSRWSACGRSLVETFLVPVMDRRDDCLVYCPLLTRCCGTAHDHFSDLKWSLWWRKRAKYTADQPKEVDSPDGHPELCAFWATPDTRCPCAASLGVPNVVRLCSQVSAAGGRLWFRLAAPSGGSISKAMMLAGPAGCSVSVAEDAHFRALAEEADEHTFRLSLVVATACALRNGEPMWVAACHPQADMLRTWSGSALAVVAVAALKTGLAGLADVLAARQSTGGQEAL